MTLPNADRAFIDLRKLRDYCLSDTHPVGKHKARVFDSALGMKEDDAFALRDMILAATLSNDAVPGVADEYGTRYSVDFTAATAIGRAIVRSSWIVRNDEDFARLASCYVLE